jgi:hypothetical protein
MFVRKMLGKIAYVKITVSSKGVKEKDVCVKWY